MNIVASAEVRAASIIKDMLDLPTEVKEHTNVEMNGNDIYGIINLPDHNPIEFTVELTPDGCRVKKYMVDDVVAEKVFIFTRPAVAERRAYDGPSLEDAIAYARLTYIAYKSVETYLHEQLKTIGERLLMRDSLWDKMFQDCLSDIGNLVSDSFEQIVTRSHP